MSHIHVCLVSEQTIPNILSTDFFKPDELLFITTVKMEALKKTDHILQALAHIGQGFNGRSQKVVVQEDSLLDCKRKLDDWISGREGAEFTVNLTGGTKIMSIAVYEYFKDYGSRMIYIPVGKNGFLAPFPKRASKEFTQLPLRLSVSDYLAAYGLKVINQKKLAANHSEAVQRQGLSEWIVRNYEQIKPLLERLSEKLRKYRDERKGYHLETTYVPQNDKEQELFNRLGFLFKGSGYAKQLSQSEIMYLTGGWLEEFCYNEIAQFKGKGIDDVVIGIIPESHGRKNEFDVMFTKDNALYTVECKSLDQNDDKRAEALYKIAALQKDFGLRIESFFVSTSPHILRDGQIKPSIAARAEQFKTTVIPPHDVVHFAQKVAERLNIGRGND